MNRSVTRETWPKPVMWKLCVLALVSLTVATRYTGHKLLRVVPQNSYQVSLLNTVKLSWGKKIDFWAESMGVEKPTLVRVPPESMPVFERFLQKHRIQHSVTLDNIQAEIDRQAKSNKKIPSPQNIDYESYHDYDVINNWIDSIAAECGSRCSVSNIGQSYEGRDMKVLKVTGNGSARRSIWIDSGIHAREWISPATAIWIIKEFVKNYNQTNIKSVVDKFDWYFLPMANPDGYQYSHTTERLWRKTRQPHGECFGADPNRNFGFGWGGGGSSGDPCSDIYRGPSAFSEPSCANIRDAVQAISATCTAYVSFHSFGQYWLTPWAYSYDDPPNYSELLRVGDIAADAITAKNGRAYTVGAAAQVLYISAGGSDDWAFAGANIPYSYTPELPDTGAFGFLLPPEFIAEVGDETLDGIIAMAEAIP